jgi:surface protein
VDRVRLGSQAFYSAKAFNANIGAWNTASVTSLNSVRAAFGRRRAPRRTRSVGLRRGVVCGGTADARAHLYR